MNYAISMICGAFLALVVSCFCSNSRVLSQTAREIDPICPPIIGKDFICMLGGAAGSFGYIALLRLNSTFNSSDFMAAILAGVAVGCFIRRIICPK